MLKVFGRPTSVNVQKVAWLVAELALEHEHIPVGGRFGGLDSAEFLAMNPHGRVPVIDDSGTVVCESHAILRYLAARYAAGRYWAESPAERAAVDCWMDWAQTRLQVDFIDGVFWPMYRTPEHLRDWPTIHEGLARCANDFRLLDRLLADRPFLAGENFSLADIPAGANLYRYFTLDIDRPSVPHVEAWYRRLQERSAYRQHVMLPYDELRGRLTF